MKTKKNSYFMSDCLVNGCLVILFVGGEWELTP